MTNEYEKEVLNKYSTPGLKRNCLSRDEKKEQLASIGVKGTKQQEILDLLYPNAKEA